MPRRRRSPREKLAGWGILAAVCLVIVGIFLISRVGVSSTPPSGAAAPTSVAAASAPSQTSSQAPSQASAEAAAVPPQPASPAAQPAASSVATSGPDAMDQGTRKAFILKLIQQGVFTGVQALDSPPKVGVTEIFQGLNPDLKQQFIATVYSYINNGAPGSQTLQLIDVATGKLAGTFTGAEGLKLL